MIKINELDTAKFMLQDLTEQESSCITGGATNLSNINELLSQNNNTSLSDIAQAMQNLLAKLSAQIAANIK
jgi:Na+-translocating ferredoxin:NAD+ oxidoreductase RNF subunit RnfB